MNEYTMKEKVMSILKSNKVNVKTHMVINYGKYCKDFAQAYVILKNAGISVELSSKAIYFDEFPAMMIAEKHSGNKHYFGFI